MANENMKGVVLAFKLEGTPPVFTLTQGEVTASAFQNGSLVVATVMTDETNAQPRETLANIVARKVSATIGCTVTPILMDSYPEWTDHAFHNGTETVYDSCAFLLKADTAI